MHLEIICSERVWRGGVRTQLKKSKGAAPAESGDRQKKTSRGSKERCSCVFCFFRRGVHFVQGPARWDRPGEVRSNKNGEKKKRGVGGLERARSGIGAMPRTGALRPKGSGGTRAARNSYGSVASDLAEGGGKGTGQWGQMEE